MLNENDKIIAHVSSAIAVYSIRSSNGMLTNDITMIDFILKTIPKNLEAKVSIELIDDVFSYVSGTHFDT
jgi:hypothetical protein